MDISFIITVLVLLGLCFGSFVNALVWRIRHHRDMLRERSECTHCHHVLAWNDLIPVVSWLTLRGRCRYCHKPIDDSPIVEAATSVLFVASYLWWPLALTTTMEISVFVLWLVCIVLLVALTVYDAKWFLLPDVLVYPLIVVGAVIGVLRFYSISGQSLTDTGITMLGGVAVIAGLYGALYWFSHGEWVGFGDVKLGVFIGLILGWQGALMAVFLSNVLGLLWVLPDLLRKKITPKSRIPFGPFLIAGCIVTLLFGGPMLAWYMGLLVV